MINTYCRITGHCTIQLDMQTLTVHSKTGMQPAWSDTKITVKLFLKIMNNKKHIIKVATLKS